MHVIFGKDSARALENKYTVLELDTFVVEGTLSPIPAYCIIENVGINELPTLENFKKLHQDLIDNYAKKDWNFCLDAIEHLVGRWGGELDSFYSDLQNRINNLKSNPPPADWSPTILKTTT